MTQSPIKSLGLALLLPQENGYQGEHISTADPVPNLIVIKLPRSTSSNYYCFLPSSVHESSEELTKFLLKGITNSEESINTTVFPAEHLYIVLDKDEDAFPVNLVMKKTAQRLQFNY